MAEEDLLNKMEELHNAYNRIRAEKDQAAAEANRVAEAEAARRTEETEYESDWDFHDPIHTAGSDTIFVQIYMDPPPGVPGVSKNQIYFHK